MLKIINTVAGEGGLFILKNRIKDEYKYVNQQSYYEKSALGEKSRNRK